MSVKTIFKNLQDISTRYPFVELLELGRSHENRSLLAVKIGWSKLGEETPSGVIDGGMHGREFISPATALYGDSASLLITFLLSLSLIFSDWQTGQNIQER